MVCITIKEGKSKIHYAYNMCVLGTEVQVLVQLRKKGVVVIKNYI